MKTSLSRNCGGTGITLVIDYGQGGVFTGGNAVGADEVVLFDSEFNAYKAANFAANRNGYFYYELHAHRYNSATNNSSGIAELAGDGVLVATPAGSTAYNSSANGPILPLGSAMLALTAISPFRPRRWRGAILPDHYAIEFRVLEPEKRPVAAVADQKELRDILAVRIRVARECQLTLLFDPGKSLEERIFSEQFQH